MGSFWQEKQVCSHGSAIVMLQIRCRTLTHQQQLHLGHRRHRRLRQAVVAKRLQGRLTKLVLHKLTGHGCIGIHVRCSVKHHTTSGGHLQGCAAGCRLQVPEHLQHIFPLTVARAQCP